MLKSGIFKDVMDAATSSIIVTDFQKPDNPILYANAAFEFLTGYAPEEIIGMNCRFLQGEKTDPSSIDKIRQAVRDGQACRVTLLNYRKDKTPFWNELVITPLLKDGKVAHYIGIQNDVTDLKKAEEVAENERLFTQSALDALVSNIAVLDAEGTICAVNASWRKYGTENNLSDHEFCIGANYLETCDRAADAGKEDAKQVAQGIRDVLTFRRDVFTYEYSCLGNLSSDVHWFLMRVTRFNYGNDIRIVISHTDITDRKLIEMDLQRAYDEMEAQVAARTKELQSANASLMSEIDERMQIEDALRESEARLKAQYRGFPMPTYTWQNRNGDFVLIDFNESAEAFSEGTITERLGKTARSVFGTEYPMVIDCLDACYQDQQRIRFDMDYRMPKTNEKKILHLTFGYVPPDLVIVHAEDVTEQRLLAERSQQSKKMEAIGMLAGGIAHDFNNLLMVINGYSKLLLKGVSEDQPEYKMLREVNSAGERAAALTNQLLAFSRKQISRPAVVDLNDAILKFESLLRSLVPENIQVEMGLQDALGKVEVDVTQLEQVLMNLVVNAKDAMPLGGQLTISTEPVVLSEHEVQGFSNMSPGAYVKLCVSDTGLGMSADVQAQVFDPFFTTKDVGKGTGLGLSTVYGIIEQHGGGIDLISEPDKGTTFCLYFPYADATQANIEALITMQKNDQPQKEGHILVVEDEDSVRDFLEMALVDTPYHVTLASGLKEAQHIYSDPTNQIDLLITDVILPDGSGVALHEDLATHRKDVKVLYITGYSPTDLKKHGIHKQDGEILNKPFSDDDFKEKIHTLLS